MEPTSGGMLDQTAGLAEPTDFPTNEDVVQNAVAVQGIIEVPHGHPSAIAQPGPRYKRGRGRSFFREPPKKGNCCQVPGCERSLHKLKEYYKRYKICPYHLELSHLVVEGQSIRFCQQCGRFQLLEEFDGDRRSCRTKLGKHNERRRRMAEDNSTESGGSGDGGDWRPRSVAKVSRHGRPRNPRNIGAFEFYEPNAAMTEMLNSIGIDQGYAQPYLAQDQGYRGGDVAAGLEGLAAAVEIADAADADTMAPPPQPASLQGGVGELNDGYALHPALLDILRKTGQLPNLTTSRAGDASAVPTNGTSLMHGNGDVYGDGSVGVGVGVGGLATSLPLLVSHPAQGKMPATEQQQQQQQQQEGEEGWDVQRQQEQTVETAAAVGTHPANGHGVFATSPPELEASTFFPIASDMPQSDDLHMASPPLMMSDGQHLDARPRPAPANVPKVSSPPAPGFTHPQAPPPSSGPQLGTARHPKPQSATPSVIHTLKEYMASQGSLAGATTAAPAAYAHAHAHAVAIERPVPLPLGSQTTMLPALTLESTHFTGISPPTAASNTSNQLPQLLHSLSSTDPALAAQIVEAIQRFTAQRAPPLPQQHVTIMSMKLFGVNPEQMPPDLLRELRQWMARTPTYTEVASRPGCVHLHVAAIMTSQEREALLKDGPRALRKLAVASGLAARNITFAMQLAGEPHATLVSPNGAAVLVHGNTEAAEDDLSGHFVASTTGTGHAVMESSRTSWSQSAAANDRDIGTPVVETTASGGCATLPTQSYWATPSARQYSSSSSSNHEAAVSLSEAGCPVLDAVFPLAVTSEHAEPFLLTGSRLSATDVIYVTSAHGHPAAEILHTGPTCVPVALEKPTDALTTPTPKCRRASAPAASAAGWAALMVPRLRVGALRFEAQRGLLVSTPAAAVVLDDPLAVAEVRQLEAQLGSRAFGAAFTLSPSLHASADHRQQDRTQRWDSQRSGTWAVEDVPAFLIKLGAVARLAAAIRQEHGDVLAAAHVAGMEYASLPRLVASAQDLASASLSMKWPALLRMVLPVASLAVGPFKAMDAAEAAESALIAIARSFVDAGTCENEEVPALVMSATTPLHVAVLRDSPECVSVLAEWARSCEYELRDEGGQQGEEPAKQQQKDAVAPERDHRSSPRRVSACHLVATLPDDRACIMAKALEHALPGSFSKAWVLGGPGRSALSVAVALKKVNLLRELVRRGVAAAEESLAALRKEMRRDGGRDGHSASLMSSTLPASLLSKSKKTVHPFPAAGTCCDGDGVRATANTKIPDEAHSDTDTKKTKIVRSPLPSPTKLKILSNLGAPDVSHVFGHEIRTEPASFNAIRIRTTTRRRVVEQQQHAGGGGTGRGWLNAMGPCVARAGRNLAYIFAHLVITAVISSILMGDDSYGSSLARMYRNNCFGAVAAAASVVAACFAILLVGPAAPAATHVPPACSPFDVLGVCMHAGMGVVLLHAGVRAIGWLRSTVGILKWVFTGTGKAALVRVVTEKPAAVAIVVCLACLWGSALFHNGGRHSRQYRGGRVY